ncbi:hypothetical protein [Enterovibrio norvegicus]|uniref:hypothetical protein n=1 Tax=Enterovibrio norvegicus TaxID=188144 RepID=UPI0010BF2279|nr:hypothetical protein [Enterovibrio norvegicus]TKF26280.1 hypothetical protein FCV83_24300 [Enterovibrio norvegicus]
MKTVLFGLTMFAITLFSASSHADLVEADFLHEGDGLITVDNVTGLEWLDVTYTSVNRDMPNYIPNTIERVKLLTQDPLSILYGWRHATVPEVQALFESAGLVITDDRLFQHGEMATPEATRAFLALLGATYSSREGDYQRLFAFTGSQCKEYPIRSRCQRGSSAEKYSIPSVGINSIERTYAELAHDALKDNAYKANYGHFLVRER